MKVILQKFMHWAWDDNGGISDFAIALVLFIFILSVVVTIFFVKFPELFPLP